MDKRPRLDFGTVGGFEPPTSCQYVGRILQVTALYQLSYTIHRYILLASPKPSELFCPDGHPFLSSFA